MTLSPLRGLALAGMVALLVGAAPLAQTPEDIRRAADQGDASAQFNLGLMYATGRGVPQDAVEAVAWYRQAAADPAGHLRVRAARCLVAARRAGVR